MREKRFEVRAIGQKENWMTLWKLTPVDLTDPNCAQGGDYRARSQ
jgi:hypothetical protein